MDKTKRWEGWSWTEFWKGKLNNKFIAWFVYMIIQVIVIFTGKLPADQTSTIIIISAIVTVIFMLAGAIDKAVSNAQISAEFKASMLKESKGGL